MDRMSENDLPASDTDTEAQRLDAAAEGIAADGAADSIADSAADSSAAETVQAAAEAPEAAAQDVAEAVAEVAAEAPEATAQDAPEADAEAETEAEANDEEQPAAKEKKPARKPRKTARRAAKKPAKEKPAEDERVRYQAPFGWYILKVQVNREKRTKEELERRIAMANLGNLIQEVFLPTQKYTVKRGNKVRQEDRLLYPGYVLVHMQVTPDSWFLIRETSGVGDFIGADSMPTPLSDIEVERMRQEADPTTGEGGISRSQIPYNLGDRVRVVNGTFNSMEGEVTKIDLETGRVTVTIEIFHKPTPIDFEIWDIETIS